MKNEKIKIRWTVEDESEINIFFYAVIGEEIAMGL